MSCKDMVSICFTRTQDKKNWQATRCLPEFYPEKAFG
jgi:hypothetical protein